MVSRNSQARNHHQGQQTAPAMSQSDMQHQVAEDGGALAADGSLLPLTCRAFSLARLLHVPALRIQLGRQCCDELLTPRVIAALQASKSKLALTLWQPETVDSMHYIEQLAPALQLPHIEYTQHYHDLLAHALAKLDNCAAVEVCKLVCIGEYDRDNRKHLRCPPGLAQHLLDSFPSLTALTLQGFCVSSNTLASLLSHPPLARQLQQLDLANTIVMVGNKPRAVGTLFHMFQGLQLKQLSIAIQHPIPGTPPLPSFQPLAQHLTQLHLDFCSLYNGDWKYLVEYLQPLAQLQVLTVPYQDQLEGLAELPQALPLLHTLQLPFVTVRGQQQLDTLLAATQITSLQLRGVTGLDASGADVPCSWQRLELTGAVEGPDIMYLPLHSLSQPLVLGQLQICVEDIPAPEVEAALHLLAEAIKVPVQIKEVQLVLRSPEQRHEGITPALLQQQRVDLTQLVALLQPLQCCCKVVVYRLHEVGAADVLALAPLCRDCTQFVLSDGSMDPSLEFWRQLVHLMPAVYKVDFIRVEGCLQWKPDQAARYVGALIALEEEVMAVQQAVEQGTHPDSINRFVHDIISRAAGSAGMLKPRLCPLARVDKHTTVKPAWFDRSCKEAKAALWQALRSGEALHLYRARKQAYRRLVARAKSAWSKHRAAKLLDMLKHNPGDALKMLRVKHARQQSMVPIDKWHQHLQAYFTTTIAAHEAPDVIPEPAWTRQAVPAHLQAVPLGRGRPHSVPAPAPVTTHAPTYELPHLDNITSIVQAQLRELNNDTAPGLDGVPAPFIKHARTVEEGVTTYLLLPLLATWFHSMMRTGCIPAAWKVARISPLFKDTDPTDPNKYRMLAVSSVLYRLYANVLRHVLTAWCMTHKVLPAEQFGFIPGRSTMQPMFILRHLVHAQKASADAKHRKLYTAFIDFKQAYDHIPRQQLWEHLRVGVKLPQPLLACLEGLYRDDSYVLIDGPHRTPPVIPDQGVKQGCPISPLLFALYVHDISKEFLGPVDAVRVQGTPVTHFMYADDLTLVSTSPHGLQRLVCQLQGFADRKHLTVNVGKSKVMVFNGNSQTAAPRIGYKHEILPVVREFKYLGMHFNPSATPAFAATHMRAGMFLAMRQACKRAREYGVLHDPYALCHLIRAFVLPLGLYGSQVWGTAFLGHGMQLSNPVQTRMLSFLRFAARVRGSVSGLMVLHELGQLPLQLYWLRAACKFWNTAKLSHSDLLMRVIKADVELGRGCQASWSAQFQLAARELMGGEFTLSPDMVLGTKAMEVKWLERQQWLS
ncbi:hypothetical protein QJQ45_026571 [Haematococcus lacustris]|nr:hypothetical protein QJQ45_026571 [Haematococcus lacustris]